MQQLVRRGDKSAVIRVLEVDVNVASQSPVFVSNHGRSTAKGDTSYLSQRNLRPRWRADQHPAHLLDVVAEVPLVANIDGITFTALDVLRNVFTTDAGGHRRLNVRHGETVTCGLWPVDLNVD